MTVDQLKDAFIEIYGGEKENLRVFMSPGRVNLIGEHTDYNGGFVFPAALSMSSTVVVRPNGTNEVKLAVTDLPDRVCAPLDRLQEFKTLRWGNYQLGVADELMKAKYNVIGCDMLYHDTVPLGSGLSSSAAIQVATAIALATLGQEANGIDKELDMVEMAKIAQKSEHNFVGVKCGIMDQFASAMGKKNHAIFLDCRDLSYELVPINIEGYKVVIANTNKKRSLGESKYNERREQCEKGLEMLKKELTDATCLGDVTLEQFEANKHLIDDQVILKRVEHIVREDERVKASVEALKLNKINLFGELMIASHNSLRDLYEVTGRELDTLVEEALKVEGVLGARMTGAGFGGCAVSIVKEDKVDEFKELVEKGYKERIGYAPSFYVSEISNGGHEIK